jgi:ribosomal protein L37AE/L43A
MLKSIKTPDFKKFCCSTCHILKKLRFCGKIFACGICGRNVSGKRKKRGKFGEIQIL